MRKASLEDQARTDATKAANATHAANAAHAGKTDAERTADTKAANAAHAGKSDRDRSAETRAANDLSAVKNQSVVASPTTSTPSSGNPATKGGSSWTKIESVVAGDDFYGCSRVFKAPEPGHRFEVVTPAQDWADGKNASGSGAAKVTHAFQLSDATSGGSAQVKILFGMVNGITPTGMTAPDLTLAVGSSGYVVLAVTTNSSGIATSASISIAGSMPSDSTSLGHIALGYVTKNTGPTSVTCSQSVSSSLWHQQCGASTHLFGSV